MRRLVFSLLMLVALVSPAFAGPIVYPYDGNDCTNWPNGVKQSFSACTLFGQSDGSPIIARYDLGDNGGWEINPLFPTVTGDEWTIDFVANTWTYLPGPGDPAITAWIRKFGNGYDVIPVTGYTAVSFEPSKLSHLSFYDTAQPVPEPGSISLFGIGMFACARAIRKGWGIKR